MPGMSGFELGRLLASRASPIPVIMITAVLDPALQSKAAANGSFCVLKKPLELDNLVDCLQRALAD
jgi:FixJ family two-component response regulator